MIPAPNPVFSCIDKFTSGQCDAVRVDGKRCTRGAVSDVIVDGKTYRACRKHRPMGKFKAWEGA